MSTAQDVRAYPTRFFEIIDLVAQGGTLHFYHPNVKDCRNFRGQLYGFLRALRNADGIHRREAADSYAVTIRYDPDDPTHLIVSPNNRWEDVMVDAIERCRRDLAEQARLRETPATPNQPED